MNTDTPFDWSDDPSVLLKHQPAIAVYENARGSITIRQQRSELEDEDTIVTVTPQNGEALAAAISKLAREMLIADAKRDDPATRGESPPRQITDQRTRPRSNGRAGQLDAFTAPPA